MEEIWKTCFNNLAISREKIIKRIGLLHSNLPWLCSLDQDAIVKSEGFLYLEAKWPIFWKAWPIKWKVKPLKKN